MLTVLSPSKTLDYETVPQTSEFTEPEFFQVAGTGGTVRNSAVAVNRTVPSGAVPKLLPMK